MTVPGAKGISSPPRTSFRRTTPRPCSSAISARVRSATSFRVTTTSSAAIGKSSSSRSSTSSPNGRPSARSTWRRAPTTTTSPAWKTVSGRDVEDASPPRRSRPRKTRAGANDPSTSADAAPGPRRRDAEGPHVPLAIGRPGPGLLPSTADLRLELAALLLQVHAQEPRREAREEPDHEARADQVADRVGDGDVVQEAGLLGLGQARGARSCCRRCR